jgi:hypothetical protein
MTPYRSNALVLEGGSSRRNLTIIALAVGTILLATLGAAFGASMFAHQRRLITMDNKVKALESSEARAKEVHAKAVGWRFGHPLSCPSTADIGMAGVRDAWGAPYLIECSEDDTRVRSAGYDHTLMTSDDVVYPN